MSELPERWTYAQLSDFSRFIMGQAPPGSASNFDGIGTPFVKAGEFGQERPIIREWTTQPLKIAQEGDVLICVVGATSGKVNLGVDCAIGRSVAAIRPQGGCDQRYLYAFMKTQVEGLRRASTGTAQGVISSAMLGTVNVPLAPLREQWRIVAKIDSLTAHTTRAHADLARIPALVAKYRSAVLALAFSGRLTADFHGEGKDAAHGLPDGWSIRPLGEISEIQGGVQVGKKRNSQTALIEVPYLRVANVQRGWLNLDEIKTIAVTPGERDRLLLKRGDVLMNEGGDRDKLGRGWVWNGQISECIHQNHVFRVRLNAGILPPEFVSQYANERGQQYFFDEGTQTTNLASISKQKVSALPVPVAPFDEAVEIVRRIETAFSWLDRVSADHTSAFNLLPKLDGGILAKAFRGELVPQDPNDEPANELLERAKTERAKQPRRGRGRTSSAKIIEENFMPLSKTLEQVLSEADGWIPAQTAFHRCGIGDGAPTEEIDRFYAQLRDLDTVGKLEAQAVTDSQGRKLYDRIRLKAV